ncbi:unnamed protein product [Arabidopsis thaliana]|uniref:Reverse transcriptase zinc-binding domain-containing protein n=1 Tax=Arabidopsis thaliana TaxID=3702 RepID=A0A5S9WXQ4_ARATH|nr:unnamed protein product [Arabidopsis thaliana]
MSSANDTPVWAIDGRPYFSFSSKSVWNAIRISNQVQSWVPLVWHKAVIPRHAITSWLFILNRNPTLDRLSTWGFDIELDCLLCGFTDRCLLDLYCLHKNSVDLPLDVPEDSHELCNTCQQCDQYDCNLTAEPSSSVIALRVFIFPPFFTIFLQTELAEEQSMIREGRIGEDGTKIVETKTSPPPLLWDQILLWLPKASTSKHRNLALLQGWQGAIYALWKERNRRFHDGLSLSSGTIAMDVMSTMINKCKVMIQLDLKRGISLLQCWTHYGLNQDYGSVFLYAGFSVFDSYSF